MIWNLGYIRVVDIHFATAYAMQSQRPALKYHKSPIYEKA